MQPARNHQVQDQPKVALHADRDPLADAAKAFYDSSFGTRQRRPNCPQQERTRQAYTLERLPHYARFECAEIRSYVWQFGHRDQSACRPWIFQCCRRDSPRPVEMLQLRH